MLVRNLVRSSPSPSSAGLLLSRGFATEKELKKRMGAVKTIVKITKSSKMIAAAKFKAAENAVGPARGIVQPFLEIFKAASQKSSFEIEEDSDVVAAVSGRALLVPVTADRGLCGAVNSFVIRRTKKLISALEEDGKQVTLVPLGDRAKSGLQRGYPKLIPIAFSGTSKLVPSMYTTAFQIADQVFSHEHDCVVYVWNRYNNAISYKTLVSVFPGFNQFVESAGGLSAYEIEGDQETVLRDLYDLAHAIHVHYRFAESGATEQSQRMSAMENSTKNASELMDALSLQYNRTRQARITTELVEIISGAISIDG